MKRAITLMLLALPLTACGKNYYVNNNGMRNFNADYNYCQAVATAKSPMPDIQLQGRTYADTTGFVSVVTPHGNVHGTYSSQTTYYNEFALANNMIALAGSIATMIQRNRLLDVCLTRLGWRETTKEEHDGVIEANKNPNRPAITFTGDHVGAQIYAIDHTGKVVMLKGHTTPSELRAAPEFAYWAPECYIAVYAGKKSTAICFKGADVKRAVHFSWGSGKAVQTFNGTRAFMSFSGPYRDAVVYGSPPQQDNYVEIKVGKTPFTMVTDEGFSLWSPECYKAVHQGRESNVVCFKQRDAIRYVSFTWAE